MKSDCSLVLVLWLVLNFFETNGFFVFHSRWSQLSTKTTVYSDKIDERMREFVNLQPIICPGKQVKIVKNTNNIGIEEEKSAIYLSLSKLIIQQRDGTNSYIARNVFPFTIDTGYEIELISAMNLDNNQRINVNSLNSISWSRSVIDRSGGIFDNLETFFARNNILNARKDIYDMITTKQWKARNRDQLSNEQSLLRAMVNISPYHSFLYALSTVANVSIRGVLLEVADKTSDNIYTLGAALLVTYNGYDSEENPLHFKWRLRAEDFRALRLVEDPTFNTDMCEAAIVKCTLEEMLGFSIALNTLRSSGGEYLLTTPTTILAPSNVFYSGKVDALISSVEEPKEDESDDNCLSQMEIRGPYFESVKEAQQYHRQQEGLQKLVAKERNLAKTVPKASEIKDATTFLRLKTSEKRAILRMSGLTELPRIREGRAAIDALLIPLLDVEVAYEVLRRLAETKGDFAKAAEMTDYESRKPLLAKQINEAQNRGDFALAKKLCEELNSLSILKFDPIDPNSPIKEFDVEEWYWEQRKKIYEIIA